VSVLPIGIEVAYAVPTEQVLLRIEVPAGTTVQQAIEASGVLQRFPQIDLANAAVGIFSRPCKLGDTLKAGDRIEIYRPLLLDPKEARRKRASK
jgi:putative ubiquitin-RnfH superfamily antitoxin RatB of RatAB toxin-antitoxin module